MFTFNPKSIREERQNFNDRVAEQSLTEGNRKDGLNLKALERYLSRENLTRQDIARRCKKDALYARTVASLLSIQASRQGSKDEDFVLQGIHEYVKNFGYQIESIPNTQARPIRGGGIAENVRIKDNEDKYLKSIDGLIWRGDYCFAYVFAKVVVGVGGHQDNVKREALEFLEWATQDDTVDRYVVLIDGEDYGALKVYDNDKIWIVNHIELQERIQLGQL